MAAPSAPHTKRAIFLSQPVLLGLGFAMLIAISAASIFLVNRARDDSSKVAHTLKVENSLSELRVMIRRAESSERGYLLTGRDSFVAVFDGAVRDIEPALETLSQLTADNPSQGARISKLVPMVREKVAELTRTVALRKAGQADEALAVVEAGRGETLMRQMSTLISEMKNEEEALLASRTAASNATATWLLVMNVIGVIAILIIAALSMLLVRRNTEDLRLAHRDLERANLSLEQRVRERTADLEEANKEIQSFAYIVSHDLRSPLVNIMGFTSELEAMRTDLFDRLAALRQQAGGKVDEDADLAADFEEAFGFIKASIVKMDRLIKAILELSRQGRAEVHPAGVDVRGLVASIAETMAHQLLERDARIDVTPLPDIISDRMALEQVFTNLIDNAVKYLRPDVPGRISVSALETPGYVTFLVSDNGRGIAAEDRGRVFELFRRSGPQDKPGEGIGLAHVRSLVRRMGGSIVLDSQLGEGTTFKITLPRVLAPQNLGNDNG